MNRKLSPLIAALSVSLLLSACNDDRDNRSDGAQFVNDSAGLPPDVCVSSDCGEKSRLVEIPGAENLFFSNSGRLFVSGNDNVYEIDRSDIDDSYTATAIAPATSVSGYGGMAQRGDTLYVNSLEDGGLYATTLDEEPSLNLIHPMGLASANGLVDGPQGELYVVNGPLAVTLALPAPKIVRLRFSDSDPLQVVEQSDWLSTGTTFPNGIARIGNTLFITGSALIPPTVGVVQRIEILADGSAGEAETIANFGSLPDDLSVAGNALLVSFFSSGYIALIDQDGTTISQTDLLSFDSPSQAKLGQPPLFSNDEILVTEKGLLLPNPLPYGNALSVFTRLPATPE